MTQNKLRVTFLDPESGDQDSEHFFKPDNSINAVGACSVAENILSTNREINFIQQRTKSNCAVVKLIVDTQPDVIGVSSYSYNFQNSLRIIEKILKALKKRPKVVYGGIHPTLTPVQTLLDGGGIIDFAVIGEGENTFKELIEQIESGIITPETINGLAFINSEFGGITINPRRERIRDLDKLAFAKCFFVEMDHAKDSLSHLPVSKIVNAGITSSRGCDHNCEFCTSPSVWHGGRIERKDVKNVVDEMEHLHNNFGTNYFMFTDEKFVGNDLDRLRSLCQEMIKRGIKNKMRFSCFSTLAAVNPEILDLLSRAGCSYINYGVEAVDVEVLKMMHKGINIRPNSREIFRMTREANIFGSALFMIGAPYDSIESINKVKNFVEYNSDFIDKIRVAFYTPFPGTKAYQNALDKGIFLEDVHDRNSGNINLNKFTTKVPIVAPVPIIEGLNLQSEEKATQDKLVRSHLIASRDSIYQAFYVNPKYYNNCRERILRDPGLIPVFSEWLQQLSRQIPQFGQKLPDDLRKLL